MSRQLIFVVECANEGTDKKYIDTIVKNFYDVSSDKLSFVFSGGIGNIVNEKKKKDISRLISNYDGESIVILCVDTDSLQAQEYRRLHLIIEKFAVSKHYELVWFCETIEEVIWKSRISRTDKGMKSDEFLRKQSTFKYSEINLRSTVKAKKKSNLLIICDKYLIRKL